MAKIQIKTDKITLLGEIFHAGVLFLLKPLAFSTTEVKLILGDFGLGGTIIAGWRR